MKILLIDQSGCFLDYAMRCEAAGHEVRLFIGPSANGEANLTGKGLVSTVRDWQSSMKWADLILTSDNAKYTRELEGYRDRGFPLWGANVEGTSWELERGIGQGVFESHGIPTIPSILFNSYEKAERYVMVHSDKRFVSKPIGDVDKALSYVSKSSQDMLFMLQYWQKQGKVKPEFLLQEFVPGIEMAVGGFVGRDGFLSQVLENFEFKKLMPGEIGVNTGEMGTVMQYCSRSDSLLAQKVLLPLESSLIRSGYTGYIDVAVIIDKAGNPWPLEFTSRPGWPCFNIQQILHTDPCEWIAEALSGRDTFTPYPDTALGIVVALPPFPYRAGAECIGFPVWGITEKNRYNIHPSEMMLGSAPSLINGKLQQKPTLVSAGPYVMVVTGSGAGVESAQTKAYKTLKSLEIPNSPIYRNDIGCRLEEQLPLLQANGYADNWMW